MSVLVIGVLGVVAIVAVTALEPRLGMSAPLVLVLLGVLLSFLPFVPTIEIEPEWILAGILPPLLYAASVSMPAMDFRRDFAAISGLSVVLVVISSLGLGLLFNALIPDINFAIGVALGAIISPTDAVATSIVKKLGVSPRIVTVLEGESLLNDASALVLLRSAVAATGLAVGAVVGDFAWAVLAAVGVGLVVGRVSLLVRKHITDSSVNTAISFIVPFVAYFPAEELRASGLVAAVAAGLVAGTGATKNLRPMDRIAEYANWRTVELLLEGAVFLIMGLQIYPLVEEVVDSGESIWLAVGLGAIAAVAIIAVRAGFITPLLWGLSRRAKRNAAARGYLTAMQEKLDSRDYAGLNALRDQYQADQGRPPRRNSGPQIASARPGTGAGSALEATMPDAGAYAAGASSGPDVEAFEVIAPDAAALTRNRKARQGAGAAEMEHRATSVSRRLTRRVADIDYLLAEPFGWREGAILVWAGMRGAVTVAAAQSLPATTPQRATLVLVAYVVAAGTLLGQGSTLPWLVRKLGLSREAVVDQDEQRRLSALLHDAVAGLITQPDLRRRNGQPYSEPVMAKMQGLTKSQEQQIEDEEDPGSPPAIEAAELRELRLAIIAAQRSALLEVRRLGTFSSAVLSNALVVLDAEEMSAELRQQGQ